MSTGPTLGAGMAGDAEVPDLRTRAEWMIARVEGDDPKEAGRLVEELRNAREYPLMLRLAEAISRKRPDEARNRRLYGQALIEQGQVTAAIDVLERLAARLKPDHREHGEAMGLLGRAHKQIYFDAKDKASPTARAALRAAIAAYRKPFEREPPSTWHGVNLVALLARVERDGPPLRGAPKASAVAARVLAALDAVPADQRDEWHAATRAEAALGLGDWDTVHAALKSYVGSPQAKAFMIAGTLRQFTQVWSLEAQPAGAELVAMLRARLLAVSQGELRLAPEAVMQARRLPEPGRTQLEAVLGDFGTSTWKWWKTGLDRAAAVCVVRSKLGQRLGTGWLVRAGDLGRTPADELLVMTNYHVVNAEGSHEGLTPDNAEVVFEAVDLEKVYTVQSPLVWSSPPERHDAALLRLHEPVQGIAPLPLAKGLPLVEATARVYVIGYPGGRSLAYSLQDNALIDHEGPLAGKPAIDGVVRVHYRAPTEGGSSGSPVFNASGWEVIALHHKGGKLGMPMLNGKPGTYAANEGVSLASIVEAMKAA
ncbi:MAG: trypsin-like peptidase domain-containing protein [Rubrivivax sp.]|nr:trypsin-like peptidase domain-containing protein [Rubrivivax sp.]